MLCESLIFIASSGLKVLGLATPDPAPSLAPSLDALLACELLASDSLRLSMAFCAIALRAANACACASDPAAPLEAGEVGWG